MSNATKNFYKNQRAALTKTARNISNVLQLQNGDIPILSDEAKGIMKLFLGTPTNKLSPDATDEG